MLPPVASRVLLRSGFLPSRSPTCDTNRYKKRPGVGQGHQAFRARSGRLFPDERRGRIAPIHEPGGCFPAAVSFASVSVSLSLCVCLSLSLRSPSAHPCFCCTQAITVLRVCVCSSPPLLLFIVILPGVSCFRSWCIRSHDLWLPSVAHVAFCRSSYAVLCHDATRVRSTPHSSVCVLVCVCLLSAVLCCAIPYRASSARCRAAASYFVRDSCRVIVSADRYLLMACLPLPCVALRYAVLFRDMTCRVLRT